MNEFRKYTIRSSQWRRKRTLKYVCRGNKNEPDDNIPAADSLRYVVASAEQRQTCGCQSSPADLFYCRVLSDVKYCDGCCFVVVVLSIWFGKFRI